MQNVGSIIHSTSDCIYLVRLMNDLRDKMNCSLAHIRPPYHDDVDDVDVQKTFLS